MFRRLLPRLAPLRRFYSSKTLPSGANLLNMPALSPTMTSGTISKWSLMEGDSFSPGDLLCEVETDKATVDFEALDEGFLASILVSSGTSDVAVGSPIAIVTETEEAMQAVKQLKFTLNDLDGPQEASKETTGFLDISTKPEPPKTTKRTSPAANLLAKNLNLDLDGVQGTGKHGIITKTDVLVASGAVEKAPEVVTETKPAENQPNLEVAQAQKEFEDVSLTAMRRVIATRMVESKTKAAHSYMSIKCEVDEANSLRQMFKQKFEKTFSLNDLVILAAAKSLESVQALVSRTGFSAVDVSVAVATKTGLITPIVKNASKRGLLDINATVKELADRARAGKLAPEEYTGGSFTVSNLGMFGISSFTAVINQPQKAILAVGGSKKKLRRTSEGVRWVTELEVTLSFDRKAVEEREAAAFLQNFRSLFSQPYHLLI